MSYTEFTLFKDDDKPKEFIKKTKPIIPNVTKEIKISIKKSCFDWCLKPGRKVWKHTDPDSIKELHKRIKGFDEYNITEEIIEFLKNKAEWVYYPSVAKVKFLNINRVQ